MTIVCGTSGLPPVEGAGQGEKTAYFSLRDYITKVTTKRAKSGHGGHEEEEDSLRRLRVLAMQKHVLGGVKFGGFGTSGRRTQSGENLDLKI
jgi:hypothetical protein